MAHRHELSFSSYDRLFPSQDTVPKGGFDESIVWYDSVDLLAFGRKDTDVLRFENQDIAGELLVISGEADSEQLMLEDVSI